jgi:hypothetical protein
MTNHLKDNFVILPLVAIYYLPIGEQVNPMIRIGKLGKG